MQPPGDSRSSLEQRVLALERELGRRRVGGRALHSLAAALVLTGLSVPLALAGDAGGDRGVSAAGNARGEAVQIGLRNRSDRETGLIANGDGYSLRLSNVNRGDGGGAIFGCRAAAGRESCVNADNLADGQAFFFRSREGSSAGHFQADGPNAVPFTTNAGGVVANLNADKVDGLDAAQLRGQQGPAGPAGSQGEQGPQGPQGAPGIVASDSAQANDDVMLSTSGVDLIGATVTTEVETHVMAMASVQLKADGGDNDQAACRLSHNDGPFANGQFLLASVPAPTTGDSTVPVSLVRGAVLPAGTHLIEVSCNDAFGASNVTFDKGDLVVWAARL